MTMTVSLDLILQGRDADAGVYLLGRILDRGAARLAAERKEMLARLKSRLERTQRIKDDDRRLIVSTYREIIG